MSDLVPADKFSRLPERYQRRAREIARRVSEIDALCQPASAAEVGTDLKRLRSQFLPQPDTEVRDMVEGFRHACRDLPAWAISEAANDFLDGKVEGHTGRYMPICAEFAKRVREILRPLMAERSSLRIEASKLVERAVDEERRFRIEIERQQPEVKRRVANLVAEFMAGATKRQSVPHRGLDAEQQRRIDALKKARIHESKITQTRIGKAP